MRKFLCIAIFLCCENLYAQEFTFVMCNDTAKHVSVQKERDYCLVHFHLRVRECAGNKFFARVRMRYPGSENKFFETTSLAQAEGNNELWSFYFRVPTLRATNQSNAIYQIEIGQLDELEVETHPVVTSFAWKITRVSNGTLTMEAHDEGIPIPQRIAHVEGGRIVIRYGYGAPSCEAPIQFSIVNNLEDGDIPGERAAKRLN